MTIDTDNYSDFAMYKRLLSQVRPHWLHITFLLALNLLSTPLALLNPLPLKIVVDSVINSYPLPVFLAALLPADVLSSDAVILVFAIVLFVTIAFLTYIRGLACTWLETYTGERLVLSFRVRLFRYVQRLSLSYHDTKGTSDSTYRIYYDAPCIQWVAVQGVIPFITAGFTLVGMIYITARIDWQLALVAMTVSPVLFLITKIFRRRLRIEWSKVKEVESHALAIVQEVLSALRVVKAFGQEDNEEERFLRQHQKSVRGQTRVAVMKGKFDVLIGLTIAAGTAAALFIGVRHVKLGELTLGNFLIVMAYLSQLYSPLQTISTKMADLQASMASAMRAFTLLDEEQDVVEKPDARPLSRAKGGLIFNEVSFSYPGGSSALCNVSYEIAPKTRVGIVGATGAGKTTLISLLTRFYDPTSGQILLDGIDLRDYKLADLRRQFSIVLQEPVLFSSTISENIAYARPDASDEEIVEVAMLAEAHDFITGLPEGYQTHVGERGMTLSGGERQRIALARAFLRDSPILILDEPTSSVDMKTEAAILETMERLIRDRTTLIITHRLSTLMNCDVLIVIDDGRVVGVSSEVPTATKDLLALDGSTVTVRRGIAGSGAGDH